MKPAERNQFSLVKTGFITPVGFCIERTLQNGTSATKAVDARRWIDGELECDDGYWCSEKTSALDLLVAADFTTGTNTGPIQTLRKG
jgi:hypothetical protein